MVAQKGGREEEWRNGSVFKRVSYESLIPWFHLCVQIWRLLLLSSPILKTRQRPGRKLAGRRGKGRKREVAEQKKEKKRF